jgi:hypothetical protein
LTDRNGAALTRRAPMWKIGRELEKRGYSGSDLKPY